MKRKAFTDHLRWLADHEESEARKHRRVNKWIVGNKTGEEPQVDRREQASQKRRQRELHIQAGLHEDQWGLRPPEVIFNPHTYDQEGRVLEKNMRGHPEYRKAPGYTFGASRELRDVTSKQRTGLSHVRSTSVLDNPGPGHYQHDVGFAATCPVMMKKTASATILSRPSKKEVGSDCPHAGPGYSGPLHAQVQRSNELRATQLAKPAWSFGREGQRVDHCSNERKALRDKFSTDRNLGPPNYNHVTSLVSQF